MANADPLDALETGVLAEFDTPINLAKVAKTRLRARISTLRKQFAATPPQTRPRYASGDN